jgi:hypothetical protein
MNKTVVYSLQKNEIVGSNGTCIFQMYSLLYGIKHVLAKHDFFQLWYLALCVCGSQFIYTHGRIRGFCVKGLILVGGGKGWLVRLVCKPTFLGPRLLLCPCYTYT